MKLTVKFIATRANIFAYLNKEWDSRSLSKYVVDDF